MFTGLVQGIGEIQAIESRGKESRIRISPLFALEDYALGESIAVNGVCLTVEDFGKAWFLVYASKETLSRTNLSMLGIGSKVNLERALALGDRLGGHLVSGHIDCLAKLESIKTVGESRVYRFSFPKEQAVFVIPKGSVALDGISLTINNCGQDFLEVNVIPATQKETTISSWKPGTLVNMETDLIGKYVYRILRPWQECEGNFQSSQGLTMEFLRKYGF
ncbi:riboflavin synthase [Desulfovulcanus sp.]